MKEMKKIVQDDSLLYYYQQYQTRDSVTDAAERS